VIRVDETAPGIVEITIDRPAARNAMTFAMWDDLAAAARALRERADVRVVLVRGAGDAAFVAGTDIAEFRTLDGGEGGIVYEARVEAAIAALEALPVPAVAALAGACTGGGVSIAAACDLRIGGPGTRVGVPIARTLGNCLSPRNLARVGALIGLDAAKALVLTAALADAPTALRLGFLNEITPSDAEVVPRARALATTIAGLAPLTLRATKEMARRLRAASPCPNADDLIRLCYGSDDFRAGIEAFIAKRPAPWRGA
jgi:enoyl-CoA hydratase/carnithine racemase